MKTVYIVCELLVMLAYVLVARVVYQRGISLPPAIYAGWCLAANAFAVIAAGSPSFEEQVSAYVFPALLGGLALFIVVEATRYSSGLMRSDERAIALGLIVGAIVGSLAKTMDAGYGRLAFGLTAIVLPILLAVASLDAHPLPDIAKVRMVAPSAIAALLESQ